MATSRSELLQRASSVALVACVAVGLPTGASAALPPTALRVAPPPGAVNFGSSVAGLADVNGDAIGDLIVGALGSGHAYVVSGATRTVLRDMIDPAGPGPSFGYALAGVGDVDRDGVADVAVGAPSTSHPAGGRAFVFSGATANVLHQLAPATGAYRAFGQSVAGAGDLSGDGVPDIMVTAPAAEQGLGTVFAFSGFDGTQLWSQSAAQPQPGAAFGEVVAVTGDVSGDGVADMLVSAPSRSYANQPTTGGNLLTGVVAGVLSVVTTATSPAPAGLVYVLSGANGAIVRTIADPAPGGGHAFGAAVAPVGDQDGDGLVDHLVGEGGADQLHLYSGRDGRLIRSMAAPAAAPGPGTMALAPAGDEDGDGRDDAWVGSGSTRTAYLVNGMGTVLASSGSPSPQGSFGVAVASVANMVSGDLWDLLVGDPTEPGGGAAYLVRTGPRAQAVATRAQVPVSTTTTIPATTTVPTTSTTTPTTTVPADAMPPTATLPKPAGAAATGGAHPDTGGVDRSGTGMLALALAMAGMAILRRTGQPSASREPPPVG